MGHSLVTGLPELLTTLVSSRGDIHSFYDHNVPGAPIGWNWGNPDPAWDGGVNTKILPLVSPGHADYGTFDTIVVTEGVPIQPSYRWWSSGFYARKFFCAARRAHPNAELFLYESWGHMQRTDPDFPTYYSNPDFNPGGNWDFVTYQRLSRPVWNAIADEASNPALTPVLPALTPVLPDYTTWRLPGGDPGNCTGTLDVKIVPTGQALANLIERIAANRVGDNWTYAGAALGGRLSMLDLFSNPYTDFPSNTTTVHGGEVDDIHPSNVLLYLNALVHSSVIYRKNPANLPAANGVPENIASILREVAWETVTNDSRTGVNSQ